MTPQEVKLWVRLRALRALGYHFRRQCPRGRYILDFACLAHRIAIEVDGSQHADGRQVQRDATRDAYLEALGFRVIRVWNVDVDQNLDGVVELILLALQTPPGPPHSAAVHPPRSGEGSGRA